MAKLTATEALGAARLRAIKAQPYVTAALYRLRPVESKGLGTVATDAGWRLYYDPEVITAWTSQELAGALLHEVWHCLRNHMGRRGANDPQVWNIAADEEINDDLPVLPKVDANCSAALPAFAVTPEKCGHPEDLLAEEYLALLKKQIAQGGGPGQPGSGIPGSGQPGVGNGKCGGCAGNPSDAESKAQAEAQAKGELPDAITPADVRTTQTQVAQAAKSAAAKGRGSVPAGIARWAEATLGPEKIPWRRTLKAAVRGAIAQVSGLVDFTYSHPARRRIPGIILPAMRAPLPEVAIVIDTSGSVDDGLLAECMREVRGCIKALHGAGVRILSCDAQASQAKRCFNLKQVKSSGVIQGGGGTDMGIGLQAASELRPKPTLTVVLTDGDTPWPADKPNCGKIVVGIVGGSNMPVPSWATAVQVEGDE